MKKNIFYILILVILVGLFSPITQIQAASVGDSCNNGLNTLVLLKGDLQCQGPAPLLSSHLINTCPSGQVLGTDNTCLSDKTYYLLAPLPCTGTGPDCVGGKLVTFDPTSNDGQNSKLGEYLNLMIRLFIGICAVLAVIMIVMGGIQYMTSELPGNKEAGRERIKGALFGLLLALGAWTLLSTINPDILNTDLKTLTTQAITVTVDLNDRVPQTPVNGKYINSSLTYATGENWAPRAGQLANLNDSGARVYNSECTTVGQPNCTSTAGLNPSTLNTIHQQCPTCTLLITGGTEFWAHGGATGSTTHQIGSSTVDLDPNPALNTYLSGGKPLVKMTRYPPPNGPNLYEGNHWHVGR